MESIVQPQPVVVLRHSRVPFSRVPGLSISTDQLHQWVNCQRLPWIEVEYRSGMCRQAVWKRLRNANRLVMRKQKGGAPGVWMTVQCAWCGTELRRRTKLSVSKLRNFCNAACYYAALEAPGYFPWRQGSRLARAIVAQHYALEPLHIVHHKDGDQRNNDRHNLMVFASQADHMAHHRGRTVTHLWDGAHNRASLLQSACMVCL